MSGFDVSLDLERRAARDAPFRLNVSFCSPAGITVIFGPSGSGKTTLLLAVLGALRPRGGRIEAAGRLLYDASRNVDLPIRSRGVGMVFQDAPLFPHLDVVHNAAFGLRGAGRLRKARGMLERVGAADLAGRRPGELSGGERQRVALARALAAGPSAVCLDEPFSALDRPARDRLGQLLVDLQSEIRIPFLHVTHDLGEALRLGHHLVLLSEGSVSQSGPPAELIARPASIAAARALGTENLFRGTVRRHLPDSGCSEIDLGGTVVQTRLLDEPLGGRVALGLRAEDILLSLEPVRHTSARNVLTGRIESLSATGGMIELTVTTPVPMRVVVTPISVRELALEAGKSIHLLIKAAAFHRMV